MEPYIKTLHHRLDQIEGVIGGRDSSDKFSGVEDDGLKVEALKQVYEELKGLTEQNIVELARDGQIIGKSIQRFALLAMMICKSTKERAGIAPYVQSEKIRALQNGFSSDDLNAFIREGRYILPSKLHFTS